MIHYIRISNETCGEFQTAFDTLRHVVHILEPDQGDRQTSFSGVRQAVSDMIVARVHGSKDADLTGCRWLLYDRRGVVLDMTAAGEQRIDLNHPDICQTFMKTMRVRNALSRS